MGVDAILYPNLRYLNFPEKAHVVLTLLTDKSERPGKKTQEKQNIFYLKKYNCE